MLYSYQKKANNRTHLKRCQAEYAFSYTAWPICDVGVTMGFVNPSCSVWACIWWTMRRGHNRTWVAYTDSYVPVLSDTSMGFSSTATGNKRGTIWSIYCLSLFLIGLNYYTRQSLNLVWGSVWVFPNWAWLHFIPLYFYKQNYKQAYALRSLD